MASSIVEHFADLPDPRRAQGRRHALSDMIVIAVTAVIGGADAWTDMYDFEVAKLPWFKTFLKFPHGIPGADTFERVFVRLAPAAFERCFKKWARALRDLSASHLVSVDGMLLRRSFDHAWSQSSAAHLISAFATENATVFGQIAMADNENENSRKPWPRPQGSRRRKLQPTAPHRPQPPPPRYNPKNAESRVNALPPAGTTITCSDYSPVRMRLTWSPGSAQANRGD